MKYLLYLLLLTAPSLVLSQATEEELLQSLPPSFTVAGPAGTTEIHQNGIDHRAIVQTEDSYVQIQQSGEANLLEATQQGANSQLRIQQHGMANQYSGTVVGDNNRLGIAQRGQDNLVHQDLLGNDLHYRVTQEGQRHELIQREHDPLAPAYEVHQQGTGMQITIEQGFVGLPPVEP